MGRMVFITRGDERLGMGHLHRVSWLAQAVQRSGHPDLEPAVVCVDSPEARGFWHGRGIACSFAAGLTDVTALLRAGDSAVIDWLETPVPLAKSIRAAIARPPQPGRLALLDDYGPALYQADLVVNALLAPLEQRETRERGVRVLSGAAYVQLPLAALALRGSADAKAREAASLLAGPAPRTGPVHAILLSFGGLPRAELIELALAALELAGYQGKVVVIPAPSEAPQRESRLDVELHPASDEFHGYLAAADLAILAGGLSLYEAAFFGVPAVCLPVVEHQLNTALKLERAGCCRLAGQPGAVDAEQLAAKLKGLIGSARLRGRMSFKGSRLIDGRGLQRTLDALLEMPVG